METQNGVIHILATALIAYATTTFQTNFWQGLVAGIVGVALYLLKGYLVNKGWKLSGKK